jgi:TonB family protein
MSPVRPLLRLDDKLALQERHLQQLGGPPLGHLWLVLIVWTVALHAVILLLPTLRVRATLPASSPPQDFPLVWRATPPSGFFSPGAGAAAGESAEAAALADPVTGSGLVPSFRTRLMEPVPEPSPELGLSLPPPDVDVDIPPPDAAPPTLDPAPAGAALGGVAGPPLVARVRPVYPTAARSLRVEARVTVQLTIVPDGAVSHAEVLGCTRPGLGFEAAALDAVRRWRYAAQSAAASPRSVIVTVDFKFQESK